MQAQTQGAAIELRPYQAEAQAAMAAHWQEAEAGALVVMATGTGKTFTALHRAAAVIQTGGRVLWLAHRAELIHQPVQTWQQVPGLASGSVGICMASDKQLAADLVVASTQTMGRREADCWPVLQAYLGHGLPSLIVLDECHHYADDGAGMFAGLVAALQTQAPAARWLGLTATPERLDGRSLGRLWGGQAAYTYDYVSAIADGMLVPPVVQLCQIELPPEAQAAYAQALVDEDEAEAARVLVRAGVVSHTAEAMQQHLGSRCAIVFTADLAQARETTEALQAAGWRADTITGTTAKAQRAGMLAAIQLGQLDCLVNCGVLTEGTDLPCVDLIVAARPFASKVLWVQACGRGLRLYPGKAECIILDLVGASEEHDLAHAAALLDVQKGPAEAEARAGATGAVLPAWERIRTQERARWLVLDDGIWLCDLGRHGAAWLVETAQGWLLLHSRRPDRLLQRPRRLHRSPAAVGHAMALGNDLYRQAGALARPGAEWRDLEPTDGQRRYLASCGLSADTRGQASDLLSVRTARGALWHWGGAAQAFGCRPGKCLI